MTSYLTYEEWLDMQAETYEEDKQYYEEFMKQKEEEAQKEYDSILDDLQLEYSGFTPTTLLYEMYGYGEQE